jgi:uracil-DNA glycosylase family 4
MPNKDIFDLAIDYLKQQQEIYGDVLISEKLSSKQINAKDDVKEKNPISINKERVEILEKPDGLFTDTPKWLLTNTLDDLYSEIHTCLDCPLGSTRNNFVFGAGNPNADIMIIGEAPGADEDEQGLPFVGRAGQLLTKILAAIDLSRDDVYIGNIIKCRPPGNRRPEQNEVDACKPYLDKQIELIQPEFILALGATAIDSLTGKKHKMGDVRGEVLDYHGIKMLVTYHPAYLLRSPNAKRDVWEDVKKLRAMYDQFKSNSGM